MGAVHVGLGKKGMEDCRPPCLSDGRWQANLSILITIDTVEYDTVYVQAQFDPTDQQTPE